jgi:hypothetical protein
LVTTKRIGVKPKTTKNVKEDNSMAGINPSSDMSSFSSDILNAGAATPAPATVNGKDLTAKEKEVRDIRQKTQNIALTDRSRAYIQNKKLGRLLFFVTRQDSAIRLATVNVPVKGADGKRVLRKDASEEDKQKYSDGTKQPPMSLSETKKFLKFRSAKPGAIVGVALSVPAGSDISLSQVQGDGNVDVSNDTTLRYHLLSKEQAYAYISSNFNGGIKEDESIVGATASDIELKYTMRHKKDKATGATSDFLAASFVLGNKEHRKSLLTETNYFPLRTYKTVSTGSLSADDVKMLNLHAQALCKDDSKYDALCDEAKTEVRKKPDGSFETTWFNDGTPINVTRYDSSSDDDVITDVRIPVRREKLSKDGSKKTYPFEYTTLGEAGGPQETYAHLIQATKMDPSDFIKEVQKFTKSNRASKKKKEVVSAADYLKSILSSEVSVEGGSKSLSDLAMEIELA